MELYNEIHQNMRKEASGGLCRTKRKIRNRGKLANTSKLLKGVYTCLALGSYIHVGVPDYYRLDIAITISEVGVSALSPPTNI